MDTLGDLRYIMINIISWFISLFLIFFDLYSHQYIYTLFPCVLPNATTTMFKWECFYTENNSIHSVGFEMYQRIVKQPRKTYCPTVTCKPLLGIKNTKVCHSLYSFTQEDYSPERRMLHGCTSQRKVFILLINIIVSANEEDKRICLKRVGTPVVVFKDWRIWQEKLSPAEKFVESSAQQSEGQGIDLDGGRWRWVARDQRAQWRCGTLSCGPHGTSRAVWDGQGEHPCVVGTLQHGLVSGRGGTSRGTMPGDHERTVATGGALTKRASRP